MVYLSNAPNCLRNSKFASHDGNGDISMRITIFDLSLLPKFLCCNLKLDLFRDVVNSTFLGKY